LAATSAKVPGVAAVDWLVLRAMQAIRATIRVYLNITCDVMVDDVSMGRGDVKTMDASPLLHISSWPLIYAMKRGACLPQSIRRIQLRRKDDHENDSP
jgi:hypothetical protein